MENENKEKKVVLTDEELKEVEGGVMAQILLNCQTIQNPKTCIAHMLCKWTNGRCENR
jgi:bacteriocin-like protein